MNYKVLYRKYRPQDFDSVVGQSYTTELLKNTIKEDKISHAYIFTGPRGTGKTSSAKIFAKAINCLNPKDGNPCNKCELCKNFNENPDIIEIDAASNNGVDDIRELIDNARLAPAMSKYKVYIIDEFHMLSTSAFNALLLTLEEPPQNVVFILATTDIQSVPITVLSRCQRFDFKPITVDIIVDRLKYVCKQEKIKITDEALKEIAIMSNGGLRDALSILDQISSKGEKIEVEDIVNNFGSISNKKIYELIESISDQNTENIINLLNKFKTDGIDYRILTNKFIELLKNELINVKLGTSKYDLNFNDMYNLIIDLSNSINYMKNSIDPYIYIELNILKYLNNVIVDNKVDINTVESNKDTVDKSNNINTEESSQKPVDKIEDNNTQDTDEVEETVEEEQKTKKHSLNTDIRVNNCFVNAKKNYLATIKEKWNDFLIYESNANKKLMSFILDTDIVAASDSYAILTNNLLSTAELINDNIKSLENDFKIFYGMDYKFVCLDQNQWNECKEKYIFNIKNNIKYSIIEEEAENELSIEEASRSNEDAELEDLAAEIFGNNIEIK